MYIVIQYTCTVYMLFSTVFYKGTLTINVPLFKKLRDIIFFAGQSRFEPFQGKFWGGQDFFDSLNCTVQVCRLNCTLYKCTYWTVLHKCTTVYCIVLYLVAFVAFSLLLLFIPLLPPSIFLSSFLSTKQETGISATRRGNSYRTFSAPLTMSVFTPICSEHKAIMMWRAKKKICFCSVDINIFNILFWLIKKSHEKYTL